MQPIYITYLNGLDIEALAMTDEEILAAIETSLAAQGNGQTVIEPRMHLTPNPDFRGHFNVLRGYIAPLDMAGVKVVGDYVDNYKKGCRPSWRCSICSIRAPACRARSWMPPRSPISAPAR